MISIQLAANILLPAPGFHCRRLDLIDEPAILIGDHNNAGKMRVPLDWFVLEIDVMRRNKNEEQDQG